MLPLYTGPAKTWGSVMDDEHSRRFWEHALSEIHDDGFFAPVQTAEASLAEPPLAEPPPEIEPAPQRRFSNVHLVLIVIVLALLLAVAVVNWLAPALM